MALKILYKRNHVCKSTYISIYMILFIQEEKEKDNEELELNDFITTVKNMTGLWDILPDESAWLHFENKDHNTGKNMQQ